MVQPAEGKPNGYYANVSPLLLELLEPPPGARVLDVGCAAGALGALLKRDDPRVFVAGIEAHEPAAARAQAVLDELWGVDIETWEPPARYRGWFDRVVFGDVLEHLLDPEAAVRKAAALLRPGGAIVASIPNVRWLPIVRDLTLRGEWTYRPDGVLDETHLRFFTRRSMIALFERCGLQIEQCRPAFSTHWGVVGVLLRLLARWFVTFEELCAIQYVLRARMPSADEAGVGAADGQPTGDADGDRREAQ